MNKEDLFISISNTIPEHCGLCPLYEYRHIADCEKFCPWKDYIIQRKSEENQ